MKKYFAAFTATALISIAPFALAASSTDLTVTGTITPNACTPSFSDSVIDFGKVPVKDLSQTGWTKLGSPLTTMTVNCDAKTTFAMRVIENRAGTSVNKYFGLGRTAANELVGYYTPYVSNVMADGQGAMPIMSADKTTWTDGTWLEPAKYLSAADKVNTGIPVAMKDLTMDMQITTWIAPANGLTVGDGIAIDGSATFEMTYL